MTGRVAIVTGGSRGLGKEMAEGLAEAGAALMLCARREEWLTPTVDEFLGRGFRVEGKICDVVDPAQVQAVVDATVAAFAKVSYEQAPGWCLKNAAISSRTPRWRDTRKGWMWNVRISPDGSRSVASLPSLAISWTLVPADRAIRAPAPRLSSTA